MPNLVTKLRMRVRPHSLLLAALALPFAADTLPARAQDVFGFLRPFSPPAAVVPLPVEPPFEVHPSTGLERPKHRRPRPKPVAVEQATIKPPKPPKAAGAMANPVPELLADSTLRAGDMVMFPDGLRVFTGQPGSQHKLSEFVPLSRAGKTIPPDTRKLVAHLRPGENLAWSTDGFRSDRKLALNRGVETTGAVERADHRGSSRSR